MMRLTPKSSADELWAAEQILKNGSCGAVGLWQANVRPEALRRLNLASQTTDTWVWLVRPLSAAMDASTSPLHMSLRPAAGGVSVDIIKRKELHSDELICPAARYAGAAAIASGAGRGSGAASRWGAGSTPGTRADLMLREVRLNVDDFFVFDLVWNMNIEPSQKSSAFLVITMRPSTSAVAWIIISHKYFLGLAPRNLPRISAAALVRTTTIPACARN